MLKHIPGKTNTKADILSRTDQVNTKEDNKDVQLLKEKLWQQRITADITIIKRNMTKEKEVVQALNKEDGLTWEEYRVVYMEGRIYVLNNKKIKEEILKENHDLADVGHPGQHRMLELIKNLLVARAKERCQEIHTRML